MSPDQGHGGPPPTTSDPNDPDATVLRPRPAPPPPPAEEDVGATIAFPQQAGEDVGATIAFPQQAGEDVGATIAFPQQAGEDVGATIAFPQQAGEDVGATIAFTPPPAPAQPADPGATIAFTPPPPAGLPAAGVAAGAAATAAVTAPPPNPELAKRAAGAPAWPVAPKRKRSKLPWVLTFFLLAAAGAVAAYLLLHRNSDTPPAPAVGVTQVVVTSQPTAGCNSQVTVTAAITTNGQAGTITYQWARSDGQQIAAQQLDATANQTTYQVTLLWSVAGKGRFDAVATLTVTNPTGVAPASGHFVYSC